MNSLLALYLILFVFMSAIVIILIRQDREKKTGRRAD